LHALVKAPDQKREMKSQIERLLSDPDKDVKYFAAQALEGI
jgi:hypothetical protein